MNFNWQSIYRKVERLNFKPFNVSRPFRNAFKHKLNLSVEMSDVLIRGLSIVQWEDVNVEVSKWFCDIRNRFLKQRYVSFKWIFQSFFLFRQVYRYVWFRYSMTRLFPLNISMHFDVPFSRIIIHSSVSGTSITWNSTLSVFFIFFFFLRTALRSPIGTMEKPFSTLWNRNVE